MKAVRLLFLILCSLLLFSLAVSAATQVSITPSSPKDSDDLKCNLDNVALSDLGRYLFLWYINGAQDRTIGNTWVYPSSRTNPRDYIVCAVFAPGQFFVGTASVNVASDNLPPQQNRPPVIDITSPSDGSSFLTGTTVQFTAVANDPENNNLVISWDFGDGSSGLSNTLVPAHKYNRAGTYNVILNVNDGVNFVTDRIVINFVGQDNLFPPVAKISADKFIAIIGEAITFRGDQSFDPDGNIVNYNWEFGDGTSASGLVVQHSYSPEGVYIARLTVTDNDGLTSSDTLIITVNPRPNQLPVPIIETSVANIFAGIPFQLIGTKSFDPDGNIVNYNWDLGDGRTTNGPVVQVVYQNPGVYAVSLEVMDDKGSTIRDTKFIVVNPANVANQLPPIAKISADKFTVGVGEAVTFNWGQSSDPDGNIVSYSWSFGDGSTGVHITFGGPINPADLIRSHAYTQSGQYKVDLVIFDNDGLKGEDTITINVLDDNLGNRNPVAVIDVSNDIAFLGFPLEFKALRSFDPDGFIVAYKWDFGDETINTNQVTKHTYINPGLYTVTLTVTDDKGATGSKSLVLNAGNVDRGPDYDKQRVEHGSKKVEQRDIRVGRLMPLNYKFIYSKGENIALLTKLVNEGNVDETVDLRLRVPEFNYVYVVRNVNLEAKQVKWVMLNLEIPTNAASGLHLAKLEVMEEDDLVNSNNNAFWDFVVA